LVHDFFREAAALAQLGGALAKLLVQRDEGRVVFAHSGHFVDRHDDGAEETFSGRELQRSRALFTLEQELNAAEPALDLSNPGDDTHRIEDVGRRLVSVVSLRYGENEALSLESGLDGSKRSRPAGCNRRRQPREDDRSSKWEDGKCLACRHRYS
jgi:hypothetical protein